jgi:hypothetical protein
MKGIKRTGKAGGFVLLIVSVIAFVTYTYLLMATDLGTVILKLTVLGAVAILLAVFGWIGYTIITAPQSE